MLHLRSQDRSWTAGRLRSWHGSSSNDAAFVGSPQPTLVDPIDGTSGGIERLDRSLAQVHQMVLAFNRELDRNGRANDTTGVAERFARRLERRFRSRSMYDVDPRYVATALVTGIIKFDQKLVDELPDKLRSYALRRSPGAPKGALNGDAERGMVSAKHGVRRSSRRVRHAGWLLLPVALAIGATIAFLAGFRVLIVLSGSMAPTIDVGDVVLTRLVKVTDVQPGTVITFRDPSRSEQLVTHRMISKDPRSDRIDVVTRGDANSGVETWSISSDGRIGRVSLRVPKIGIPLQRLVDVRARFALLLAGAALISFVAIRRVWDS